MAALLNLFRLPPPPMGIAFSNRAVEAIAFRRRKNRIELSFHKQRSIPKGAIENGLIIDAKKVVGVLRKLRTDIHKSLGAVPSIVTALPEEHSFLQVLSIPTINNEEKLAEAVRWETAGTIPEAIDEVVLDYAPLPTSSDGRRHSDVLVGTAPVENVAAIESLFKEVGFHLIALDIESLALVRALFDGRKETPPTLVVDIGETRTSFTIVGGSAVLLTSTIEVGVSLMEEALQRELSLEPKEAEYYLKEVGVSGKAKLSKNKKGQKNIKEDDVLDVLLPILTDLNQQVREYLSYYRTHAEHAHTQARSIQNVLLSGRGSTIRGLTEYLALQLRLPVRQGNPWEGARALGLQAIPEIPFKDSLSYTTTIGLALHSL